MLLEVEGQRPRVSGRERVLDATYDIFSRRGIGVGVDELIAQSGVARATFYRHFPTKDDLVLAFLARREELWLHGWLGTQVRSRAASGAARLVAIFEVFDEWFHSEDFDGCAFIRVLLDTKGTARSPERATIQSLGRIRDMLTEFAVAAGACDPDQLARQWHILMKGSIVAATEGDLEAAGRARDMGIVLLAATPGMSAGPVLALK